MSFKTNLTILSLSLLLSSCAYLRNPAEVMVTIDSEPIGAKIYIDGEYRGDTIKQINLVPNKDYKLRLVKDGYQTVDEVLRTTRSYRRQRSIDRRRCRSDMIFSPLILPFFSLMSDKCRDFERKVYFFEMARATMPMMNMGYPNVPPQYVPPHSQGNVDNHYNVTTYYTITPEPTEPASASYNDPYQNYYNQGSPRQAAGQGQVAGGQVVQNQAPNDFDSSYKAPMSYDQNYQPVAATVQQEKPPHIY